MNEYKQKNEKETKFALTVLDHTFGQHYVVFDLFYGHTKRIDLLLTIHHC